MSTEHIVTVLATRDRDDRPAYRAVCSDRTCQRRWKPPHRALTPAGMALAEHDGREHRKYRAVGADRAGGVMREIFGDLFECPSDAIVIPVNWTRKRNGEAVMGAGVAKQAAERYPEMPQRLGLTIHFAGGPAPTHMVMSGDGRHVVAFPTKGDWRKPSRLEYIEIGAPVLVRHADHFGWQTIALPRLGCGLGQLDWESQVRPLLAGILDDRFVVVAQQPALTARPGAEDGR